MTPTSLVPRQQSHGSLLIGFLSRVLTAYLECVTSRRLMVHGATCIDHCGEVGDRVDTQGMQDLRQSGRFDRSMMHLDDRDATSRFPGKTILVGEHFVPYACYVIGKPPVPGPLEPHGRLGVLSHDTHFLALG
jgi:hypothetical protein